MDDAQRGLASTPQIAPKWWLIGRASLAFLAESFSLGRENEDVVNALILTAVVEANVAPVNQDPELQRRFSALDAPPPDELRRPVSISAVAASLSLPYETVRRRLAKLARTGICTISSRGVVVPTAVLNGPAYARLATARYERLKQLYFELKAAGAFQSLPAAPEGEPPLAEPPIRAANRAISEYSLRAVEAMMRRLGDPLTGMVVIEMGLANFEHFTPEQMAFEGPMPDESRRPVPMLTLATRLGLPAETVRRHVRQLEEAGFCRKVRGGRLAVLQQLMRPGGGHGLIDNFQNVQRMFVKLAAMGVLAYWEAEAAD